MIRGCGSTIEVKGVKGQWSTCKNNEGNICRSIYATKRVITLKLGNNEQWVDTTCEVKGLKVEGHLGSNNVNI